MPGSVHITDEHGRSLATTDSAGNPAGNVTLGDLISGEDQTNDVLKVEQTYSHYEAPVSATTILGGTGAAGDYLHTVTFRVNGTGAFQLKDGSDIIIDLTGVSGTNYIQTLTIDAVATTNWTITNTAGVKATASGRFTA